MQPGGDDESNRMIAERLQRQHVLYQPGKHVRVIMLEAVLRSDAAGGALVSRERGFLLVPRFPRGRRMIAERHCKDAECQVTRGHGLRKTVLLPVK